MRIKSYYANSVEDGMAMARAELGPDAMLVNSRRTPPETRHLGGYEVVIVTDLAAAEEVAAPPAALPASGGRRATGCRPTSRN
jgi:flagellar biosynthesis GTPase FlhF